MAINMIVSSHGLFAQEALRTVEMIVGTPQEDVKVVSVTEGKTYDQSLAELLKIYNDFEKKDGTLILVDIFGGTPANISTHLALTNENIQIYSGLNIPILLELCLANPATLEDTKKLVESTHDVALVDITGKIKEGVNNDGDQVDSY